MLKTYSTKGNTCIIPFTLKTPVSVFTFSAEFKGGDSFGLGGKTKRATYRTRKAMEQFAIEASEMFKKGLVTLDDAVDTPAEAEAKAKAAARRIKRETEGEVNEELEELVQEKQTKKTAKK
jgi:hypothetical protein